MNFKKEFKKLQKCFQCKESFLEQCSFRPSQLLNIIIQDFAVTYHCHADVGISQKPAIRIPRIFLKNFPNSNCPAWFDLYYSHRKFQVTLRRARAAFLNLISQILIVYATKFKSNILLIYLYDTCSLVKNKHQMQTIAKTQNSSSINPWMWN